MINFSHMVRSVPRIQPYTRITTSHTFSTLSRSPSVAKRPPHHLTLCLENTRQIMAFRASSGLADQVNKAKFQQNNAPETESESASDKDNDKSKEHKKSMKTTLIGLACALSGIAGVSILLSLPERDDQGNPVKDEFSDLPFLSQHFGRIKRNVFRTRKEFEEPFSDKLLPDPLPEPYHQPKYTILLEIDKLLVSSEFTLKHGNRFKKRPGLDMFISQIGYPNFEVVTFTVSNANFVFPVIEAMDPNMQFIMYRLFTDAARFIKGNYVKDISVLNRDPKKVIIIDHDENSVQLQRENALILPKWEGNLDDRQLIGLAQLLNAIQQSDIDDVREVLAYYRQFDDPIEAFRENQRKLQAEMEAESKKQEEQRSKPLKSFSGFGSVFGKK